MPKTIIHYNILYFKYLYKNTDFNDLWKTVDSVDLL